MNGDTEPEKVGDRRVMRPKKRIPLGQKAYEALRNEAIRQGALADFRATYEEAEPQGEKLKPVVYLNRKARRAAKRR